MTMKLPVKWWQRRPERKPMRTLPELAEEFGITTATLSGYMRHHGGPKPPIKHTSNYTRSVVTYYDSDEVRKWWKQFKEQQK
jgi:hypothetical protein